MTTATPARRAAPVLMVGLAVVALGLANGTPAGDGDPLDPRSTGPLGARALVLLLEGSGATVDLGGGVPPRGATALVLADRLGPGDRAALGRWVDGGGLLVVADPGSSFAPRPAQGGAGVLEALSVGPSALAPGCDLPAVSGLARVEVPGAAGLRAAPGSVACFPLEGAQGTVPGASGWYLVARARGRGSVVALGGAGPLVNTRLAEADNAALALSLLAPRPGATVSILDRSRPGSGDRGLADLVPGWVTASLWQLALALVLVVLWRARRLGRPVLEVTPVQISGSELVVAVGNLLQRARRRDQAAAMLRAQLRRTLADRLGLPSTAPAATLAAAAASRSGVPAEAVAAALDPNPPPADPDLAELARSVESLRNEVTRVP